MKRLIWISALLCCAGCPVTEEPAELADLGMVSTDTGSMSPDGSVDMPGASDFGLDVGLDLGADSGIDSGTDAGADADVAGCVTPAERGVWFYRHPGNPLGSDTIVGDAAAEAATITDLQSQQITTVYGNYGDRPITDATAIAAWNTQLDAAGIESQLLLGDGADIFPGCSDALLEQIQDRFISFNAGVAPVAQFKAIHLDVEPQQYKQGASYPTTTSCGLRVPDWPFWDDLTTAGRANRYEFLLNLFIQVRSFLDTNGHAATPLYADLAPWIDSSANFDWSVIGTIADGTDWLNQATAPLTGMTMMTYERDTAALIDGSVAVEATLATELRVSVSARERAPLSTILTWTDLNAMFLVVEELEATHCGDRPIDLFNYRYLNE